MRSNERFVGVVAFAKGWAPLSKVPLRPMETKPPPLPLQHHLQPDSCITMWMQLRPLNCTLKNGSKNRFYVMYILPQLKTKEPINSHLLLFPQETSLPLSSSDLQDPVPPLALTICNLPHCSGSSPEASSLQSFSSPGFGHTSSFLS